MFERHFWTVCLYLIFCSTAGATGPSATEQTMAEISTNSHHYLRGGMEYFYSKENGGLETLTGIPYDELACKNCHSKTKQLANGTPIPHPYTPGCADCHDLARGTSVDSPAVCLNCHSRQRSEVAIFKKMPEPRNLAYQDLHVRNGMTCISCHTGQHLHQDASDQHSLLSRGGSDARCETCHQPQALSQGPHHVVHGDRLACASCHLDSVFTCTNCHFDTEVAVRGKFKRPYGKPGGFMLLTNRKGYGPSGKDQVYPSSFMTIVYQGKTFYTVAPMFAHRVVKQGKTCEACHNNERVREYQETKQIDITKWNPETNKLDTVKGVVPVPEDWQQAFQLDFVDFKGDLTTPGQPEKWVFLKHGADGSQMLEEFSTPLTGDQMKHLGTPYNSPSYTDESK